MEMPIPYKGEGKYIFISYAHRDANLVWPVVQQLQNDGYRVWYDEGIDPGTEWDENIAAHVEGCDCFIAFLSRNYLASENCKDELSYSRDLGKKQILVYLQPVRLPQGLALRVGRSQSVRVWPRGSFFRRLYAMEGLRSFTDRPQVTGRRVSAWVLILLAAVAVAIAAGALLISHRKPEDSALPAQTESLTATAPQTEPEPPTLRKSTLININGLNVSFQDMYLTEEALFVTLNAVNKTGRESGLLIDRECINGTLCYAQMDNTRSSEENFTITLWWPYNDLILSGLDIQEVTDVQYLDFLLRPFVTDSEYTDITLYPFGEAYAGDMGYELPEDALLLLDTEQVAFYCLDYADAGTTVTYLGVNKTDEAVDIILDVLLNDVTPERFSLTLLPNRWCQSRVMSYEWEDAGVISVEKVAGTATVICGEAQEEYPVAYYPRGNTDFVYTPWQETGDELVLAQQEDLRILLLDTLQLNEEYIRLQLYVEHWMDDRHTLYLMVEDDGETVGGTFLRNCQPQEAAFIVTDIPREDVSADGLLHIDLSLWDYEDELICRFFAELEV